jgi:hypothetical protein
VVVEETAKLIVFVRHVGRSKQKTRALDRARGYDKLLRTNFEGSPFIIEHAGRGDAFSFPMEGGNIAVGE